MKHFVRMILAVAMVAIAAPAEAQLFYVGLRGGAGIPTGAFKENDGATAEDRLLAGAKTGFGYGLDAGINLGPIGVYAGFDHINFDCEEQTCTQNGKYKLQGVSAGVRLSVPLFPIVKPWIKGGVTFQQLEAEYGQASSFSGFKTDQTPGYEVGVGVDIPLGPFLSLTPQARYIGQKLDYKIPGVTSGDQVSTKANYYTFDLGLRLRSPI